MEAVTHLEKVIVGEVSAVTHLEKVIAGETSAVTYTEKVITGEAPPITHLQRVIAGVESPVTHLEYVWAGRTPEPTEHEYTGVVPYSFNADGTPLLDWYIKGNTVQSATPTPDNPIMPEGTGERTGNLFDVSNILANKYITTTDVMGDSSVSSVSNYCYVYGLTQVTLSFSGSLQNTAPRSYCFYDSSKTLLETGDQYQVTNATTTFVVPSGAVYMRFTIDNGMTYVMLNTGSTALPYEPYGYKIPISSANTTTPIYLGEVETTRRVKKLVLTGQENWLTSQENYYISVANYYNLYDIGTNITICSHFEDRQELVVPDGYYGLGGLLDGNTNTKWNGNIVFNPKPLITTKQDWMNYLAAQYAAGTPVTIWYVLANEETAVVNEPLMKIGDYADEVSNVATIPTNNGSTTIDVDTTVKPSEVYIKYKGV